MSDASLSPELALRVGLAARELPEAEVQQLVRMLTGLLGVPLTAEKLAGVTPAGLRDAAGRGHLEAVKEAPLERLEAACRALHGEAVVGGEIPEPDPSPALPGAVRVACASNSGGALDGHFGSCARFLVYEVSPAGTRLAQVRPVAEAVTEAGERREDKNRARVALIADCQLLYVCSIGAPAAAKVVNAGVFPMKIPDGGEAAEHMGELSTALATQPPPWLARVMDRDAASQAGAH
ncbi:MAG: dinitrogenase iron-molybdenum cofactor biosynthesis protein [Halorhodospira sp.]